MKRYVVIGMLALTALLAVAPAQAGDKPIQIALFSPVQIFSPEQSIAGLRISILYGRNVNMTGLDWGLVTRTTGKFEGVQWGVAGFVDGNATGIQANWVNITRQDFTGLQWGVYNSAGHAEGVQVGLLNTTGSIKGLQIGLLNFIQKGGWLPFFPIVNGNFK
jgi:hypothetical protein